MAFQLALSDIVNILIFFSMGISSYVIFYFSQRTNPHEQVTFSIFILALGLTMIGLSHLFRVGSDSVHPFITISALLGGTFTFFGFGLVSHQQSLKIINLKRRQEEVRAVITNLKEKYYKQEISEEDLKSMQSILIKELAELEVKMRDKKKNPEEKERKEQSIPKQP